MTAHYRSPMNFTWGALQSAENALKKLFAIVESYKDDESSELHAEFMGSFMDAVNDDLNMPKALAVLWELLKAEIDEGVKLVTLLKFDEILGFGFDSHVGLEIPQVVKDLVKTREMYRQSAIWDKADFVRRDIEKHGYVVEDSSEGSKIKRKI